MSRITVLGAGLVGQAIVRDLCTDGLHVKAVDASRPALQRLQQRHGDLVDVVCADLRAQSGIAALVSDSDLVVCAVPGHMGFETLKQVIDAGRNVVDISFSAEDPFELDALARARGVTAVVDCGLAPGLCNVVAGHVAGLLDACETYACLVGGLPQVRRKPFEYRAVFSPADVIEEYTRPARLVEFGQPVVRPALSDVELLDFPQVGTLEAFNTDGLRTLMRTLPMPSMREKTLRYPGHAELMRILRDSGFFEQEPLDLAGTPVSPLAVTSRILFDQWRLQEGEGDVTVMQVVIEGSKGSERVRYTYDLLDYYDTATKTTSMARTTGYTCAIVARQVLNGRFRRVGVCPPEYLGQDKDCYAGLLVELGKRHIDLRERIERLAQ